MTIKEAKIYIQKELSGLCPGNEISSFIKIIFSDLFSINSVQLISKEKEVFSDENKAKLKTVVSRLQNSEPLQYIIGHTEFFGLKFRVNKNVLIPRPETEELVDMIIKDISANKGQRILDIGTGTGCIPVSLAKHLPYSDIFALDISEEGLKTAKINASENNVHVTFIQGDILSFLHDFSIEKFDIIVSNPPYVRVSEKKQMEQNVLAWEPEIALFVDDNDPLIFYDAIAKFAKDHLSEKGKLYFEINEALGPETRQLLIKYSFSKIEILKDISGKDRFVKAQRLW